VVPTEKQQKNILTQLELRVHKGGLISFLSHIQLICIYRWELFAKGDLPDETCVFEYLRTVRGEVSEIVRKYLAPLDTPHHKETNLPEDMYPDRPVPLSNWIAVVAHLVLYGITHELWHVEDLISCRHLHSLSPPSLRPSSPSPPSLPLSEESSSHNHHPPTSDSHPLPTSDSHPLPTSDSHPLPTSHSHALPTSDSHPLPTNDSDGAINALEDVSIPGGTFYVGAERHLLSQCAVVLDNQKWAHPVQIRPFRMSRCTVTNQMYLAFVEAGGYDLERSGCLWSAEGLQWLMALQEEAKGRPSRTCPPHWIRPDPSDVRAQWRFRWFDQVQLLPPNQPVTHVSYYEAEAYCKWAHRRLPTGEQDECCV
jgi:hypothetical protein